MSLKFFSTYRDHIEQLFKDNLLNIKDLSHWDERDFRNGIFKGYAKIEDLFIHDFQIKGECYYVDPYQISEYLFISEDKTININFPHQATTNQKILGASLQGTITPKPTKLTHQQNNEMLYVGILENACTVNETEEDLDPKFLLNTMKEIFHTISKSTPKKIAPNLHTILYDKPIEQTEKMKNECRD